MDYLRKLQSREKILLLAMIVLIIIVCIYLFFSSYINQSKLAKSKLLSAKSDYEYVYKRYQQIERSVWGPKLDFWGLFWDQNDS